MKNMNVFALKPSKRSPFVLWVFLLFFVTAFAVYICSFCLKQIAMQITPAKIVPVFEKAGMHCDIQGIPSEEVVHVHYPCPKTYNRGECACTPVRFFVILSMQRSGSGWFETLINSHPNISSNGEIFSVRERRSNVSTIFTTLDTIYRLDWFSSAAKNECVAAVGFKWMLNQAEVLARFKPRINIASLIPTVSHVNQMMQDSLLYFNSTRHIILYYEDIVNNCKTLSYVQKFLRVPVRKLKSRQVKIHTKSLPEQVENWEDVHKALNGTQHEHFLHGMDSIS